MHHSSPRTALQCSRSVIKPINAELGPGTRNPRGQGVCGPSRRHSSFIWNNQSSLLVSCAVATNATVAAARNFETGSIYFGVAGILIIIAMPNPGFADPSSLTVRIPAYLGFSLYLVAMVTNIISLVTGAIAWAKGSKHCVWIVVSLLILLFPLVLYVFPHV